MLFDCFEAYDVQETRRISREEGKIEGKAESILNLLEDLGPIPKELQEHIFQTMDLEQLRIWLKLAAKAESMEEFCQKAGFQVVSTLV